MERSKENIKNKGMKDEWRRRRGKGKSARGGKQGGGQCKRSSALDISFGAPD